MAALYRFDPTQSRFTVQAFATGMLAMLGHSPTFAARDFRGEMRFAGSEVRDLLLELTVPADAVDLIDRVKDADRREIMDRMRREVLEVSAYPEIRFQSTAVSADLTAPDRYKVRIGGRLSLHGVTQPHEVGGEFLVYKDGVRLRGETSLKMSEYRIKPVSALGGTIRLGDALKLVFDIVGLPRGFAMNRPRVLIAGVGNIFLGDDGFGVEVAQRFLRREQPEGVRVVDFGIRGLDLSYTLLDGFEAVILVDAVPRGGAPGTLYVLEPDMPDPAGTEGVGLIEGHGMDPVKVLRLVAAMGGKVGRLLLVGCEPAATGGGADEMQPGLSEAVGSAVDLAVVLIESLAARLLRGEAVEARGEGVIPGKG